MIGKTSGHSGRRAERLVNTAEVVVEEIEGHGANQVLDLLGEAVCQAGKPPHAHPHGKVLPLNVTGGDVVRIGSAKNDILPAGMYPGDNPSFTLSVSGLGYIYLQFGYDDNTGVISSVQILSGVTIPVSTASVVTKQIGSYENSGQALANSVTTSLWFERCGYLDLFGTA
jgi:hypothetical protein